MNENRYHHTLVMLYPDQESNLELSFRRASLYPFNYQGVRVSRLSQEMIP